jgi:hypothetical protein
MILSHHKPYIFNAENTFQVYRPSGYKKGVPKGQGYARRIYIRGNLQPL